MKPFLFSCALFCMAAKAQQPVSISPAEKRSVVDSVAARLQQYYVFPEKAKEMAQYLKKQSAANAYQSITDYRVFLDTLFRDLQRVHKDPHMGLQYNPQQAGVIKSWRNMPEPPESFRREMEERGKRSNFGFVKVERLPGNIGYLDFRQFFPVTDAAQNTVASAMGFLANSDALIIDLRKNGGGDPRMVQLIVSYFLEKPVHYNSIYDRRTDSTEHFYAIEKVNGPKMPATDLYILTSKSTFSGAEEFSYNMKNLKRATLIGETTGGGAHPTSPYNVNDKVVISIPFARAINPFTKTNWEGTGVEPDIKTEAASALQQALIMITEKALARAANPQQKSELEWTLTGYKAALHPPTISQQAKAEYVGTYGERKITLSNGQLHYQRGIGTVGKLIPLTEDLFQLDGVDYFRVQFVRNKQGRVEKINGLYDNGRVEESIRSNIKTF